MKIVYMLRYNTCNLRCNPEEKVDTILSVITIQREKKLNELMVELYTTHAYICSKIEVFMAIKTLNIELFLNKLKENIDFKGNHCVTCDEYISFYLDRIGEENARKIIEEITGRYGS